MVGSHHSFKASPISPDAASHAFAKFAGEYYMAPSSSCPNPTICFITKFTSAGDPSRQLTMSLLSIPFEGQAAIHLTYFQLHIYLCYF